MSRPHRLSTALEGLADFYTSEAALDQDPLILARRYPAPADQEVAAWVAAHLAYGRVAPMLRAIAQGLEPLGHHPSAWLRERNPKAAEEALQAALIHWKWRFHKPLDLVAWILAWKRLDAESAGQGLEPHLTPNSNSDGDQTLSTLVQRLRKELPPTQALRFCLPDPLEGAACKRWRMFLRWMVREGWPDLGLWKTYPASELKIPVDTHVARVSRFLGFTKRQTPDATMVEDITAALRAVDPLDPLRFDFALAHLGILGHCPGRRSLPGCRPCPLVDVCRAR